MARTALTIQELTAETASADLATLESADAVNGNIIETGSIDSVLVLCANPGASAATVEVVQADSQGRGIRGGPGNVDVELAAGEQKWIGGLSARFEQVDGAETGEVAGIYLDVSDAGAADVDFLVLRCPVPN